MVMDPDSLRSFGRRFRTALGVAVGFATICGAAWWLALPDAWLSSRGRSRYSPVRSPSSPWRSAIGQAIVVLEGVIERFTREFISG